MKKDCSKKWLLVYAMMTATAVIRVSADQPTTTAKPECHYTGTVVSVDLKDSTLATKGIVLTKNFNLGDACTFGLLDKTPGSASDLRPGEKVRVSYQDANGVLIADRVEQQPMRVEGMVKRIDPVAHTLIVHGDFVDKSFKIANDCNVLLRDEKSGALADIQTGNQVTVTYETPGHQLTARQIAQTSIAFTGRLTAIDLEERTVKAKSFLDTKKFILADNCAIVVNGKLNGKLGELKPNDRLVFSYDEINGVNMANRIAPVSAEIPPTNSVATTAPMRGY